VSADAEDAKRVQQGSADYPPVEEAGKVLLSRQNVTTGTDSALCICCAVPQLTLRGIAGAPVFAEELKR
jgi:hypothetical protein